MGVVVVGINFPLKEQWYITCKIIKNKQDLLILLTTLAKCLYNNMFYVKIIFYSSPLCGMFQNSLQYAVLVFDCTYRKNNLFDVFHPESFYWNIQNNLYFLRLHNVAICAVFRSAFPLYLRSMVFLVLMMLHHGNHLRVGPPIFGRTLNMT